MSSPTVARPASVRGVTRGEIGLLALFVVLLVLTLVPALSPQLRFAALAPSFDLLINGIAMLIAGLAAWLSWLRHRHMADPAAVYQAAAFLIFTLTALVQVLSDLNIGDQVLGLSLDAPRQAPVYVWTFLRLMAGGLLLRSAWLRLRPPGSYRGAAVVLLTLAASIGVFIGVYAVEPLLPPLLGAEAFDRLGAPDSLVGPLPGITLLELGLQAIATVMLALAAGGYALAARRARTPSGIYLSAGLTLAAFAQVHFALFPGIYSGLVTSSDVLRIVFYAFVLIGLQADAGATLRDLRAANRRLHDLRDVELTSASLAERARLAREVHDGLAQQLWLAKLTTERLGDGASTQQIAQARTELVKLLDAGLDEARQTVAALREAADPLAPLVESLARHVRRFEEATGLDTSVALDDTIDLPPRSAAELMRIAQEALNNVRKHADATVVAVELVSDRDVVRLSVRDNGVGFDLSADHPGYGLESMRERAAAAGGRLLVESSLQGGTTVVAEVPLARSTTGEDAAT
jgi:signal transduction histidine kinase